MIRSVNAVWLFALLALMFNLQRTSVCRADDGPVTENTAAETEQSDKESDAEAESEWESERAATMDIQSMLRSKKFTEATEAVDKALKQWPDSVPLANLNMNLVMMLSIDQLPLAKQRFEAMMKAAEAAPDKNPAQRRLSLMMAPSFALAMARAGEVDESLALLDRIESGNPATPNAQGGNLLAVRATILSQAGRTEEATSIFHSAIDALMGEDDESNRRSCFLW